MWINWRSRFRFVILRTELTQPFNIIDSYWSNSTLVVVGHYVLYTCMQYSEAAIERMLLLFLSVCEVLRFLPDGIRRRSDTDGVVMATNDARWERYTMVLHIQIIWDSCERVTCNRSIANLVGRIHCWDCCIWCIDSQLYNVILLYKVSNAKLKRFGVTM